MSRTITLIFGLALLLAAALPAEAQSMRSDRVFSVEDSVLTIPKTAKSIPPYAFADRQDIAEVIIPGATPLEIGEYAFMGCRNLRRVIINRKATFGAGTFRDCESLEELNLPTGVVKLPYALFYGCISLRRVGLPASLKIIGAHAFAYCRALERIEFPARLTEISNNAFSCCASLREVTIPSSVTLVDSYAFSDCTTMRKITFPANQRRLGELILSGCRVLEEIDEPSPVPPAFECESFPMEPDESGYSTIKLKVPSGALPLYRRAHGWCLFTHIEPR